MIAEENANRLLQERGYIVIAGDSTLRRGEVVDGLSGCFGLLNHKVVVIRETDKSDWKAQQDMFGKDSFVDWQHYYRAVAE